MHGVKSDAAGSPDEPDPVVGAWPQPARAIATPAATAALSSFLVVEMVNSCLPQRNRVPRGSIKVTYCFDVWAYPTPTRWRMVTKLKSTQRMSMQACSSEHIAPSGELQRLDDALHPLRMLDGRHQQRIGGVDHDDVLPPDEADHTARLAHEDAARSIRQHSRLRSEHREVVLPTVRDELRQRGEVAHVVPVEMPWDHGEATSTRRRLRHGVVDRDLLQTRPDAVDGRTAQLPVIPCLREFEESGVQFGLVRRELVEQHTRLGDEHAGVPEVAAIGDVRLRRLQIGL